ncbi:hypothetical protein EDC01DRAFT_205154 [Geopyxis carbonaria]|nr:hypothetical protein EDC01DRAFT_205154 [Geopyxis carbonaria]
MLIKIHMLSFLQVFSSCRPVRSTFTGLHARQKKQWWSGKAKTGFVKSRPTRPVRKEHNPVAAKEKKHTQEEKEKQNGAGIFTPKSKNTQKGKTKETAQKTSSPKQFLDRTAIAASSGAVIPANGKENWMAIRNGGGGGEVEVASTLSRRGTRSAKWWWMQSSLTANYGDGGGGHPDHTAVETHPV